MTEVVQTMEEKKQEVPKEEKEVTREETEAPKEEKEMQENGVDDEKEDGEDDEEGSDDESSEEELGSLEKPVEILDRKRDRKSTERLTLESQPKTPKQELDYTQGKGKKFGEIAFIKHQLEKTNAEELKTMHRILFSKVAKVTMVKKNIRTFCGFPFEKDSAHYKRVDNYLDKTVMPQLKFICGVMGLEKNGDKVAVKERMLEFLINPIDMEKPIPGKKKKAEKKKNKSKKSKPKKEGKSDDKVSDVDSDDEGDDESEEKKKKSESPKKKTPKKESPKKSEKKKKTPKQAAIKLPVPKKKKATTPKKRKAEDDSEDDEPLVKKPKGEPSDAELKKVVSSILQDADLEQITMKTVVKQVYEKYPDFDLTPRKDFIKNTVKEIIS